MVINELYHALVICSTNEKRNEFMKQLPNEFAEKLEDYFFCRYLLENQKVFDEVAETLCPIVYERLRAE